GDYLAASSRPHGWIPAFAGMTHVGLVCRDTAVVPRRFLFHTLVVKISDTSYHGKRVRIPPLFDRAVESALRGPVRRGWRALREKSSAFRSGNLRNRLFPGDFVGPRGTRGPNLFSGGE